jgi:hypothetical protein
VADDIDSHAVQLGVDGAGHWAARRLKRHLGYRFEPMAVGLEIEVTEAGYAVHGREMGDVNGVFEDFLRVGPEPPPRRFGYVEGECASSHSGILGSSHSGSVDSAEYQTKMMPARSAVGHTRSRAVRLTVFAYGISTFEPDPSKRQP